MNPQSLCTWLEDVCFVFFPSVCFYDVMQWLHTPSLPVWDLFVMAAIPTAPHPHPWCPGLTPARRMRELEEELRLMDQNLKSMVCGEEEVLAVRSPAFCSSDLQALSRFLCFLSNLRISCVTLTTATTNNTSSSTETLGLVIFYTVPV